MQFDRRPQAAADSSSVSFVAACWMFAPLARIQHLLPGHSWGVCRYLGSDFDKLEETRLIDGMQWSIQTHSSGDLVWKTQKSGREIWGFRLKFSTCSGSLVLLKNFRAHRNLSTFSLNSLYKRYGNSASSKSQKNKTIYDLTYNLRWSRNLPSSPPQSNSRAGRNPPESL